MVSEKRLDKYRNRLRDIDEEIVNLLKERIDIAKEIGKIKQENNLPVRNYEVEEKVITKMTNLAREKNVDEHFIKEITKQMITAAVDAQEEDYETNVKTTRKGDSTCTIVGAQGGMGKWFTTFLNSKGYRINQIDKDDDLTVQNSEMILVAVPQSQMNTVLQTVIQKNPSGVIVEISSMKNHLRESHTKARKNRVDLVSIHPMFGPNTKILSGENLILCKKGNKQEKAVKDIFANTALNVITVPLDKHDTYMNKVLTMPHFINIAVAEYLNQTEEDFTFLSQVGGTTFNRQIEVTNEVINENAELYHEIQHLDTNREEMITALKQIMDAINEKASQTSSDKFNQLMANAAKNMNTS